MTWRVSAVDCFIDGSGAGLRIPNRNRTTNERVEIFNGEVRVVMSGPAVYSRPTLGRDPDDTSVNEGMEDFF